MQSRGGLAGSAVARQRPVRLFLSGPAAGVIGGAIVGRSSGRRDLITIDVGGTSSDIALVEGGEPVIRSQGSIASTRLIQKGLSLGCARLFQGGHEQRFFIHTYYPHRL